ncbi:helix-turn-helix transcriptional regulator [Streptomyces pratensis]|uniref:helix-turn-helix transcriptional regulator n=1 Tax=Streptomyces pratensis TaxID=1169025 RepID=UPI0030177174
MSDKRFRSPDSVTPDSLGELLASVQEIERLLHAMLRLLERGSAAAPAPPGPPRAPAAGGGPLAVPSPSAGAEGRRSLTPREGEVFALLLTGMSNRAIARRLGITERTVKNNLHAVYRKLGVAGRAEAMAGFLTAASDTGRAEAPGAPPGDEAPEPRGRRESPGGSGAVRAAGETRGGPRREPGP